MSLLRAGLRIDAGVELPGEGPLEIAVEVIAPEQPRPQVLFCLPGGGMTRRYFDLQAPGDDSYSFATQMAARGFISVLVDHLGVGESSRPKDSYALTPELLASANRRASAHVISKISNGSLISGLQLIPHVISVGIGHSMGAMLTVLQQAQTREHAGIAVLGFSTRGLPEFISAEACALAAADHAAARRESPRLARALFGEDYPVIGRSAEGASLYSGRAAEPTGVEAIKAARAGLLPVPAFMSMLPGNVAPEAAAIDVPVLVGLGERDLAGPPLEAPKAFTGSPAVSFELLPGAGHSHFLFPARQRLFDALALWASTL